MLSTMHIKTKYPQLCGAVRPNANVLSKRLGDEMVLFHLDTDHFYELNGTAARFWELINSGHSTGEVRRLMLEEFLVDPEQFAEEAEALINSLRQEDLISVDE